MCTWDPSSFNLTHWRIDGDGDLLGHQDLPNEVPDPIITPDGSLLFCGEADQPYQDDITGETVPDKLNKSFFLQWLALHSWRTRYNFYFIRCSWHSNPKMMFTHLNLDDGLPHDDGGCGHETLHPWRLMSERGEWHRNKRDVCQGESKCQVSNRNEDEKDDEEDNHEDENKAAQDYPLLLSSYIFMFVVVYAAKL